MGRIGTPTTTVTVASRNEARMRELDRKVAATADRSNAAVRGEVAVAAAPATVTTTATTQAGAATVAALTCGLSAGRRYRIHAPDLGVYSNTAGHIVVQLTYTLDGSAPTSTSPRLKQTASETSGNTRGTHLIGYLEPGQDVPLSALLSVYGVVAGTYGVAAAADWPALLVVEDVGAALNST